MRALSIVSIAMLLLALLGLAAPPAAAQARFDGTVALGGVVVDEIGDRSTMVETYNVFDGFSVSQIRLTGSLNPRNTFTLNLREINLDSRKGELVYRMPGRLRVNATFDQWRQIYDSDAAVTSDRKDWRAGVDWTALRGHTLRATYGNTSKTGDRIAFPAGTTSALGSGYDYTLQSGMIEGDVKRGSVGVALAYNFADYTDNLASAQDRFGQVIAARLYGAAYFWPDKLTHMLRGSYGKQELSESGLSFKSSSFQYTGVVRPNGHFQFKYNFHASRIDDDATHLQTDDVRNSAVLTYYHKYGDVYGGYSYETTDDDRNLTQYNAFLVGASVSYARRLRGQIEYGNRDKEDEGKTTLLQDIESTKFLANLRYEITDGFYVGGKATLRTRTLTVLDVDAEGKLYNAYGGYEYTGWGSIITDYSYSADDYDDLDGGFSTKSHIVTGRLQLDRIRHLTVVGGVTYLDIGENLNIEKSILFLEGKYTVMRDFFVEAKYNIYNYDDYVAIASGRYYTANVVWFNVGYNFTKG
jgi:hypothetical protein